MAIERIDPIKHRELDIFDEHLARYHFVLPHIKDKRVLDVGCGAGYGSYYLKKMGASYVKGVDNSNEAIRFAKSNYQSKNLDYLCLDFLEMPTEKYDVVNAFEFIEHVKDPKKYLGQMVNCMTPSGLLILSTPYIDNPAIRELDKANPFHLSTKTIGELQYVLRRLGIHNTTVWYQQKTREYLEHLNETTVLNTIFDELYMIKINLLFNRLKKMLKWRSPAVAYPSKQFGAPVVALNDWEFSLFLSHRTEIILLVCRKTN